MKLLIFVFKKGIVKLRGLKITLKMNKIDIFSWEMNKISKRLKIVQEYDKGIVIFCSFFLKNQYCLEKILKEQRAWFIKN